MNTNKVLNHTTVTLAQAATIILATPENRYALLGEPGIGKSTLQKAIMKALPDHEHSMVDVPNLDLGDVAMPVINRELRVTEYYRTSASDYIRASQS